MTQLLLLEIINSLLVNSLLINVFYKLAIHKYLSFFYYF